MEEFLPDYHFIAIGGIGQSALAKILLKEGKKVSGSDVKDSKYIKQLEKCGAKIFIGHSRENIIGKPTIVVSSAIKEDNPELIEAKGRGLKIIHRSDMLKIISDNYTEFMGFCGTHGKTTTSGLCTFLLSCANLKPAYAIGGIIPKLDTNGDCEEKNTKYFIAELDESDGTVVKYSPRYTLINNLEADHPDFYKNGLEDVINTFTQFITGLKDNSKVLINIDDFGNNELIKKNPTYRNFISYATKDNSAKYVAKNIKLDTLSSSFDIYNSGKLLGQIELSIPGEHNVANALGVCALLIEAGIEFSLFAPYFREFTGMGRRFQKSAQIGTITVIDDYAHHPAEIKATLEAVKNYNKGRVFAIFQPHRYSRFQGLYNDFLNSFDNADFVAVLDVYTAGEKYTGGKTAKDFTDELSKSGKNAKYYTGTIDEAASEIVKELRENDLVFTLGAGDITKMGGVLNELYLLKK